MTRLRVEVITFSAIIFVALLVQLIYNFYTVW